MVFPAEGVEPRFILDCMLGKLAKWLRILGYDTLYFSKISDVDLLRMAEKEGRVLLTRDTRIGERRNSATIVLVHSGEPEEQLKEIVSRFKLNLSPERVFSRCLVCNTPITLVEKKEVAGRVPPYVYRTQQRFAYCPTCDRIYWRGTHIKRVFERLRLLMGKEV
ncbi:MAG: Mut7-C RNAse domain-containing protein [Acidobacteria bacterium]|nr:Mut7-C RNAse domain-containing protein [Acidobacteriota bacterium]